MEKNNNARINDFLKACEKKGHPILSINACDTQRTLRQRRKSALNALGEAYVHFKGFHVWLTLPLSGSKAFRLPDTLAKDFAILTGQPSKDKIEVESEIIKGCTLLGASYKGGGKFVTPCGVAYHIPLDKPVKAQEVRDAVICDLAWHIDKKPRIFLTRI